VAGRGRQDGGWREGFSDDNTCRRERDDDWHDNIEILPWQGLHSPFREKIPGWQYDATHRGQL